MTERRPMRSPSRGIPDGTPGRRRKILCGLGIFLSLAWSAAGCGGNSGPGIVVTLTPLTATVLLTNTQQFAAPVTGAQDTAVTWQVCNPTNPSNATGRSGNTITLPTGCVTSSATLGNITTTGVYTAPATLPSPPQVSIVATSQAQTTVFAVVNVTLDSGVRVSVTPSRATIGTTEQFQFTATVSGTPNIAVTWSVNGIAGGNNTPPNPVVGTIVPGACAATQPPPIPNPNVILNGPGTSVACYTAPASSPAVGLAIAATSVVDTRQIGSATANVSGATDPILNVANALNPSFAMEGSQQQDVYLSGSSFFSTDLVLVNGSVVPSLFLDANDIRAIIPTTFFAKPSPQPFSIVVQRQNGGTSQAANLPVLPTRPAVASWTPDSIPLNSPQGSVNLIGGYYSTATVATVQGQSRISSIPNGQTNRQLTVNLSASDLATPGLLPILINNGDVPAGAPATSSLNVAVPPAATSISSPISTITVGLKPTAVAIDSALGIAVVVNQGPSGSPGSVSLINLDMNPATVTATLTVGMVPTAVSVDDQLHFAAVVNSGDNTLSVVNLSTLAVTTLTLPVNPTGTTPAPPVPTPAPFSIGVNPLTHRGLVAYSSTNIATVVDLSTNKVVCILGGSNPSMPNNCAVLPLSNTRPVSTGPSPEVAVDPQLNWAVVTPGGAGAISLVDLGTPVTASQVARVPNVVATLTLTPTIQGVSIDTERNRAFFTDPSGSNLTLFSDLNQTVTSFTLGGNEVASAVNPLTDVGVVVNNTAKTATVVDLGARLKIASVFVGNSPVSVAIDPGKNEAVIVNQGDGSVSILPLGPILSPQITEVSPPTVFTLPSCTPVPVNIVGFGFATGAVVRLDGTPIATGPTNGREVTAMVPCAMLGAPRRFALDVMNPGATSSNEESFTVIGSVPVGLNPIGVAIDPTLNEALVTVQGTINPSTGSCSAPGTASLVNMASASVVTSFPVGTCPEGVAVAPRLGRAVVANNGSSSATVLDYVNNVVVSTVAVGNGPMGVAIQPDTERAAVANFTDNSVSSFSVSSNIPQNAGAVSVDQGPVGIGVDPNDNLFAVTAATQNSVDILDATRLFITGRLTNLASPTDVSFDPITGNFLVADSAFNSIGIVDPVTFAATPILSGINPTAIAYNFQSSTAVTVNRATDTMSVVAFQAANNNGVLTFSAGEVREILPVGGSDEFSVAINPMTNVAAVVDQANGRLLLVPLPR